MTTEEQTIEQRICELESALVIAETRCNYVMSREIKARIEWLKSIQKREPAT